MLEISHFNSVANNKYSALQKKNVSFRNAGNQVAANPTNAPAATSIVQSSNNDGLKNLINLIPNSYLDEIGGAALAIGLGVLSHKKNAGINRTLSQLTDKVDGALKKPAGMLKGDVEQLIGERTGILVKKGDFEQRIADTANGLKRELGSDINDLRHSQNMLRTVKAFPQQTVKVNGMDLNLATIMRPVNEGTETFEKFAKELQTQSARSVLGLREFSKPTGDTSFVRMVAVELKPFTAVGGLSSIPKEMAEELPKIVNQTKKGARFIMDTPMYTGRVAKKGAKEVTFSLVQDADGAYKYQKRVAGAIQKDETYKLDLIDEFEVPIVGEKPQKVRLFQTQVMSKPTEFSDDTKKLFKPELLEEINAKLARGEDFETDNYKIFRKQIENERTGDVTYKDYFQTKLTYNLWDNEKFTMDLPLDRAPGIYEDDAFSSNLLSREVYFNKYIYEHTIRMMKNNESGQCFKDGKAVLGADAFVLNDWHTGPLAAMIRYGTIGKKYQQGLRPDVADKVTNMPIVSLLHNTYDSTMQREAHLQPEIEHMLNVMFDENAAKIVPNAYMPNSSIQGKGGLPINLGNACLAGEGKSFSCLNMLIQLSDSVHPVSDGYAKECAHIGEFGKELKDLYLLRTKEGFKSESAEKTLEKLKAIATNNGIDVTKFKDEDIMRSTFYGIDNGLNKVNESFNENQIAAVTKELNLLGIKDANFKALSPEASSSPEKALEWKQTNKKSVIQYFIQSINSATGREASGPMNAWLGKSTDLTGVTENTPIFATAGRITKQKGYETYLGAIKKYIMSLPKDENYDYPVFITQGGLPKNDEYSMQVVNLIEKTKNELVAAGYKKAADRIVLLDRGDGGKYTITKLLTDFPVMASNYEPCGLTHKEFMNMAGGITLGNVTGGIPSGLPDATIVKVPFDVTSSQEAKINNFADGIKKILDIYKDKNTFAKGIQESLKLDFTWAKEGNSGSKYVDALASKGVFTH